jgi:hypothetical protein
MGARTIDGASANAECCTRLGNRGVEVPPVPTDLRSPGTRITAEDSRAFL